MYLHSHIPSRTYTTRWQIHTGVKSQDRLSVRGRNPRGHTRLLPTAHMELLAPKSVRAAGLIPRAEGEGQGVGKARTADSLPHLPSGDPQVRKRGGWNAAWRLTTRSPLETTEKCTDGCSAVITTSNIRESIGYLNPNRNRKWSEVDMNLCCTWAPQMWQITCERQLLLLTKS